MFSWVYWDDKFQQMGQQKPMGNKKPKYVIGGAAVIYCWPPLMVFKSEHMSIIPEVVVAQLLPGPWLAAAVGSPRTPHVCPCLDVSTSHQASTASSG